MKKARTREGRDEPGDGRIRVLIAGCGNMGSSHARAYLALAEDFEIVGLVSRGKSSSRSLNERLGGNCSEFHDFHEALAATRPDAVCIATYPDTHAEYAIAAMEAGAHVFVEKPLAQTVESAEKVIATANRLGRKLEVGYILNVHPTWKRFVEMAGDLGRPLVMRMNLNQQSSGANWETHKRILESLSPIVDCGVHYVDVMCRMTRARPVKVNAIGARLSGDIAAGQVNYGHLQVVFADGSVGWYEAGWGPMMSEIAYFVKDVIGPAGSVSIVPRPSAIRGDSADVNRHTKSESLLLHRSKLTESGELAHEDEVFNFSDEPDHDGLCRLEQQMFLRAIRGEIDMTDHLKAAVDSLRIVLAAEQSFREGRTIEL